MDEGGVFEANRRGSLRAFCIFVKITRTGLGFHTLSLSVSCLSLLM